MMLCYWLPLDEHTTTDATGDGLGRRWALWYIGVDWRLHWTGLLASSEGRMQRTVAL